MTIIIYNQEKELYRIPAPSSEILIDFANNRVKEINFTNPLSEKEGALNEQLSLSFLASDLQSLDKKLITDIYIYFSKKQYYHFHSKVKDIYYRTQSYSQSKHLIHIEHLSIRFQEDTLFEINFDECLGFCRNECPYLQKDEKTKNPTGFCILHPAGIKLDLQPNGKYLICRECYLENDSLLHEQEINEKYQKLRENCLREV